MLKKEHRSVHGQCGRVPGRIRVLVVQAARLDRAARKPVRDGKLVADGGRVRVLHTEHAFPQVESPLKLLDGLCGLAQIQIGHAQHLANRRFSQRSIRERVAHVRLGRIHGFAQRPVLALVPVPERIGQRHVGRPARREQGFHEEGQNRLGLLVR